MAYTYDPRPINRRKVLGRIGGNTDPIDRFFHYVDRNGPNGCWIWLGAFSLKGRYGRFHPTANPNITVVPHKWIWEYINGPVPIGLMLDHFSCDNTWCCNPDHVRPVTARENTLRANSGFPVDNAAKSECPSGHGPYDAIRSNGSRYCKTCTKLQTRQWRIRKKLKE
jgi:hypothetical protein